MSIAFGILSMDLDWHVACECDVPLHVSGAFRNVVNAICPAKDRLPFSSDCPTCYYRNKYGLICQDVYLWVGAKSCPAGPGGLIIDCDTLPEAFMSAQTLFFEASPQGYRMDLANESGVFTTILMGSPPQNGPSPGQTARAALPPAALKRCADRARDVLLACGRADSPFLEPPLFDDPLKRGLYETLSDQSDRFCKLLCEQSVDEAELYSVLEKFIGLGVGLTPSADDFMVGALAIQYALRPSLRSEQARALQRTVRTLAYRTSNVSRLYLLSAAYSRFSECVSGAVDELLSDSKPPAHSEHACPSALAKLISHGSTSGTDTLAGMACMLEHTSRLSDFDT